MEDLEALPVGERRPAAARTSRLRAAMTAGAVAAAAAAAGALVAVAAVDRGDPPRAVGGSGFVWSCQHSTTAVVRFDGLRSDDVVEVHVDLRGDIALLPLTGDQVNVTAGRRDGHQWFRPEDGELALLVPLLARPPHQARLVDADDGSTVLEVGLPVLSC